MIEPSYQVEKVILDVLWEKDSFYKSLLQSEDNAQMLAHDIFQRLKKESKKNDSLYLDLY